MGKKCLKIMMSATMLLLMSSSLFAQGAGDVLRYTLQYPSYDPVSLVMPGTSDATGFGAFQENPASMALFDQSFFSLGLSDRYVNEDGTYLGNTTSFDDNQANVGDIGFVYKVPTTRGNFAIGAGYSQSHDYNRAFSGNARNNRSTITDFYAQRPTNDDLNQAAFDAFAIDDITDDEGNTIRSQSIFRFLPQGESYPGIHQNFELTETGTLGEFSAFVATEFQKNFIVGASIGVITGTYSQKRDFLESDDQGDYDSSFLDLDGDGNGDTDVDHILSNDRIHDTFTGFSARIGLIYEVTPHFNVGAGYQFKNKITIDEDYHTDITTTFDNGETLSGDTGNQQVKYKVTRPARLNLGFTLKDFSGVTFSASAEKVNYSDGEIEFVGMGGSTDQLEVNSMVKSSLKDVYNLRFGLEYQINPQFTPRIGYAYYPSPTGDFNDSSINGDHQFYSAGFSSQVSETVMFNLGVQLGMWEDQASLYSTNDYTEIISEDVQHWNIMGGFIFNF